MGVGEMVSAGPAPERQGSLPGEDPVFHLCFCFCPCFVVRHRETMVHEPNPASTRLCKDLHCTRHPLSLSALYLTASVVQPLS